MSKRSDFLIRESSILKCELDNFSVLKGNSISLFNFEVHQLEFSGELLQRSLNFIIFPIK